MRLRKRKNATVLIRNGLILMQPPTHLELHEMRNLERITRTRDRAENITRTALRNRW